MCVPLLPRPPLRHRGGLDTDGEELSGAFETANGFDAGEEAAGTDPSDGHGFDEGTGVAAGTDPLDVRDFPVAVVAALGLWALALLGRLGAAQLRRS